MFKSPMPDINRKFGSKRLFIPGGWPADLPRIEVEACVSDAWALYLRQDGMGTIESVRVANAMGQRIYEAGIRPGLLSHTMYWASVYAEMFPDSLYRAGQIDGIYAMRGFDPYPVQSSYIPFHRVGKSGQPFMKHMLKEMYDEHS